MPIGAGSRPSVAEDFRRFLAGESILAKRESLLAKTVKRVRKHRTPVIASILVVALAVVSTVLALQARRARGQRHLEDAMSALLFDRAPREATALLEKAESCGIDGADV
jgi:hypothetical protein